METDTIVELLAASIGTICAHCTVMMAGRGAESYSRRRFFSKAGGNAFFTTPTNGEPVPNPKIQRL